MGIRWTSALSVGVEELDAGHAELFERVDRLLDAILKQDRSEAGRLLAFLRSYVRHHFVVEEDLMRDRGYPAPLRAAHETEHALFAQQLDRLEAEFAASGPTARLVHALERQVVGWLEDHIFVTDQALGRFLAQGSPGRSPPAPRERLGA